MKKTALILLCMMVALSCTGCYNRREPKELAVINSFLYDINDNGQYRVTAEIMNPAISGGAQMSISSEKSPSITVTAEGDTLREAIRNLSVSLERSIFSGHNKVRFFTERFAKTDMTALLDLLLRDHLEDETPYMIVIKDEIPDQIHFADVGLADMVGNYFEDLAENQPRHMSRAVFVTTLDFVKDYYDDCKQPVMGIARIAPSSGKPSENTSAGQGDGGTQGDGGKGARIIQYEGLAAFKDGRLAGLMDGTDAMVYNFLTNQLHTAYVSVPVGEGQTVLEVRTARTSAKAAVQDGHVTLDIRVKVAMRISTAGGGLDVTRAKDLKVIEEAFNKEVAEKIAATIAEAQQLGSDIFGLGHYVHVQHPRQWREIKDAWDAFFSEADVTVTVVSSVNREGEIKEPFTMGE